MRRNRLVVLVGLGIVVGFLIVRQLSKPTATVRNEPPPPVAKAPARPLQADAEGYYEPGYRFTVSDRRFTRVTLRPEPFVTFARTGTRQEAGCLDALIRADTFTCAVTSIESAPLRSTAGSSRVSPRPDLTRQFSQRS